MIILLNYIFLLLICIWVGLKKTQTIGKVWYGTALIIKIGAGIILGIIYWFYLGDGDSINYYRQAKEMAELADHSFWTYLERLWTNEFGPHKGEARTEYFVKILSFFLVITDLNYWLAGIYLSLFNFFTAWYLVSLISQKFPEWKWPALLSFLFIPSVVFWSSGLLKESIANGALLILFAFIFKLYYQQPLQFWYSIFSGIALIVLIKLKFYVAAPVMIVLVLIIVHRIVTSFIVNTYAQRLIIIVVCLILILPVSFMDYNLQLNHLPSSIVSNYEAIAQVSPPTNFIQFNLQPTWISILKNLPQSFVYGLVGPFPFQGSISNFDYWIENLLIIVLLLSDIYLLIRSPSKLHPFPFILVCGLGYILILAVFLPIAAPNFGTLMRYKTAFLSLMWMILLYPSFQQFLKKKSA